MKANTKIHIIEWAIVLTVLAGGLLALMLSATPFFILPVAGIWAICKPLDDALERLDPNNEIFSKKL